MTAPVALSEVLRLKKRREFQAVAASGQKVVTTSMVVQVCFPDAVSDGSAVRVGFTVTKKQGNAVVRNRIRRRMRAVADTWLAQDGVPGADYVLIGRASAQEADFAVMVRDFRYAMRRIRESYQTKTPLFGKKT